MIFRIPVMKKISYLLLFFSLTVISCSKFLDVRPDMGLTDEEVFSYYDNAKMFLERNYEAGFKRLLWGIRFNVSGNKISLDTWSPAGVGGRETQINPRRGLMREINMSDVFSGTNAIATQALIVINQCNVFLEKAGMITDGTEEEIEDLKGQAYFFRAAAHFALGKFYGPWPYQDHSLKADEPWDLARPSLHETYSLCAEDFYRAYECFKNVGKMRRDAFPGMEGHLKSSDEFKRPNGVSALAFRGRALLYAASPLANPENKLEYWKEAAEANALALKAALEYRYALQPKNKWRDNFVEVEATNEYVYQDTYMLNDANNKVSWLLYGQNNTKSSAGLCPTQLIVDKFETIWGDALNTEEDRAAAVAAGHFNETGDPYNNRDPRLDMTIIHDGTVTKYGIVCNLYKNKSGAWPKTKVDSKNTRELIKEWGAELDGANGTSKTGYACQKYWKGIATSGEYPHLEGFRLAELYLNYAEAANEYAGPNAKVGVADLTAVEAVNVIRERMDMPGVKAKYLENKDSFRPRIHNERMVEFAYEGNFYWFDSRRWVKEAKEDMEADIYGIYVTEVTADAAHPNGRLYERRALPEFYQNPNGWKNYMFYFSIPHSEAIKMTLFVNNEPWPAQ